MCDPIVGLKGKIKDEKSQQVEREEEE